MDTLFLGIVIFLIVLAVFDLVVGVSNDAVNFLNSGCQGGKIQNSCNDSCYWRVRWSFPE